MLFGGRECSYTQEGCLLSDHQILKSCQMDEFRYGLTEAGFHSSSGSGFQRVSHTLARSRLCEAERWDPPIPQVFALCVDVFHMRFMTCHQAKLVSNDVGKCLSTCTASATAVCTHVRYTSVNLLGSSEDSVPSTTNDQKLCLPHGHELFYKLCFSILKAIMPVKVQSIRTSNRLSQRH